MNAGYGGSVGTSPAGVHHHNEFVPLGAVSDGQLDLTQGVLAGGRATINTAEYVSVTSREAAVKLYSRGQMDRPTGIR